MHGLLLCRESSKKYSLDMKNSTYVLIYVSFVRLFVCWLVGWLVGWLVSALSFCTALLYSSVVHVL
jgi:hypothetical protein